MRFVQLLINQVESIDSQNLENWLRTSEITKLNAVPPPATNWVPREIAYRYRFRRSVFMQSLNTTRGILFSAYPKLNRDSLSVGPRVFRQISQTIRVGHDILRTCVKANGFQIEYSR